MISASANVRTRMGRLMTQTVTLPLWLYLILLALAGLAALEWLLLPSVRWYFRRKMNRVIEEISVRLNIDIPQFKLTRRRVLIDRLIHDAKVQSAAEASSREQGAPKSVALQRVDRYAREIVPAFNAYLYFRVGYWLAKSVARFLYRVRLGYTDGAAIAAINPQSTVVFVMNHRSNMDYVLVAFLAAERVALSYAVGEWARIWPLQTLIRAMGAYFVRRQSGDPLYRMVLQRYVQMATEGGVPQAVYPEGGLTTDGRLRAPKLGLLDYMLKTFDPAGERDLVFIPVGINYDRVLEDRTLLLKLDGTAQSRGFLSSSAVALAFVARQFGHLLRRRWYRFGYACVNFGRPLSMREYCARHCVDFRVLDENERHRQVTAVGAELMRQIGDVVPVLPVSLVATVLLKNPQRAFSELELKSAVHELINRLEHAGAHVYIPHADHDYAITVGLRMLTLRRLAYAADGLYCAQGNEQKLLGYYANSIAHLVARADGSGPAPVGGA
jgi:glycerol-3-phosphate O-acyltransferase